MLDYFTSQSAPSKGKAKISKVENKAKLNDELFNKLLRVQLTPELMDDYTSHFYPSIGGDDDGNGNGKKKKSAKYNQNFPQLAIHLSTIQYALDLSRHFLTEVVINGARITAESRLGNAVAATNINNRFEAFTTACPSFKESSHPSWRILRDAMNKTAWLTLGDSTRFPQGKSLLNVPYSDFTDVSRKLDSGSCKSFRSVAGKSKGSNIDDIFSIDSTHRLVQADKHDDVLDAGNQHKEHDFNDMAAARHAAMYKMPICVAAVEAMRKIQKLLAGTNAAKGALKSKVMSKPLGFDYSQIDQIIRTSHPVIAQMMPSKGFCSHITPISNLGNMPDVFSVGIRIQPPASVAGYAAEAAASITEDSSSHMRNKALRAKKALETISDDFMVVGSHMMCGWVLDIKPEIYNFIVQGNTDRGDLVIRNWAKIWLPSVFRFAGTSRSNGAVDIQDIPVVGGLPSDMEHVRAVRASFGMSTESGGDEDGMLIEGDGTFSSAPSPSDIDMEGIKAMELDLNSISSACSAAAVPCGAGDDNVTNSNTKLSEQYTLDMSPDGEYHADKYEAVIGALDKAADKYRQAVVVSDTSLGISGAVSNADPTSITSRESTSAKLGAVEHADILGYDFSAVGGQPLQRTFGAILEKMQSAITATDNRLFARQDPETGESTLEAAMSKMKQSPMGRKLGYIAIGAYKKVQGKYIDEPPVHAKFFDSACSSIMAYQVLLEEGLVPDLNTLIQKATTHTYNSIGGDDGYEEANVNSGKLNADLYSEFIQGNKAGETTYPAATIITYCLGRAMLDCTGEVGSNLRAMIVEQEGNTGNVRDALLDHPAYIGYAKDAPLSKFAGLSNYFGGQLLFEVCKAIIAVDKKALVKLTRSPSKSGKRIGKFTGAFLHGFLIPYCVAVGKYLQDVESIFATCALEVEKGKADLELTPEALGGSLAGTKAFKVLPHQFEANQQLHRMPRYAVLNIAPGGGKTILGIMDINRCVAQSKTPIRSAIIAPNGLVGNWCKDLNLVSDKWNVIPLTNDTLARWPIETIVKIITNAPRNTIVVMSNGFISNHHNNIPITIAGVTTMLNSTVEFVVRMGFNYVILDESHKAKNLGSNLNFNLRKIFNSPSVLYKRIATGTLVVDRLTDVIGQAALLSPAMFGKGDDIADINLKEMRKNPTLKVASEMTRYIRSVTDRMSGYCAMISKRKKDWAYILPRPIDSFHPVPMSDPSVPDSDLHLLAYESVLASTIEEMLADPKVAKAMAEEEARKAGKAKGAADTGVDDDEDDAASEDQEVAEGMGGESSDDDDESPILKAIKSSPSLSSMYDALERMITYPADHVYALELWSQAGKDIKKFVPTKLLTMLDLLDKHFKPEKFDAASFAANKEHRNFFWEKGCTPNELDLCVYEGKQYIARKKSTSAAREALPASMLPPDQDTEYWKEERLGKVMIVCRYHTSIKAVVEALPEHYKKRTATFHGKMSNILRLEALEKFNTTDSGIDIIVAMEQSVTEGYNMQSGSRMIRIDNPWSPGTYEQTVSRLIRPDFADFASNSGSPDDLKRSIVNVDWLMTDGTVEVRKVAYLQQKTVQSELFYEVDNPKYKELEDYLDLADVSFSLDSLKKGELMHYGDYHLSRDAGKSGYDKRLRHFEARAKLVDVQQSEFQEIRQSKPSALINIPAAPAPADFRFLTSAPIMLPNQVPASDPKGYGLQRFRDWFLDQDKIEPWPIDPASRNIYLKRIAGLYVVTEYGNGQVVGISQCKAVKVVAEDGTVSVQFQGVPFIKLSVKIGDQVLDIEHNLVWVANAISKKNAKVFLNDTPTDRAGKLGEQKEVTDVVEPDTGATTTATVTATPSADKADTRDTERKEAADGEITRQEETKVEATAPAVMTTKIRRNTSGGVTAPTALPDALPVVVPGVTEVDTLPEVVPGVTVIQGKKPKPPKVEVAGVDIRPMVYNGVVALYMNSETDERLSKYGFAQFGEFVYCDVKTARDYFAVVDHLENASPQDTGDGEFVLDTASENRMNHIQRAFQHKGAMKFDYLQAYANRKDMVDFYQTLHRKVRAAQSDTHLKVYPAFLGDRIRLMVDLETCPAAKRLINVHYDGVAAPFGKWIKHAPMYINFTNTPAQAQKIIDRMVKAGITVNNYAAVVKALSRIIVKPE